MKYLKRFKENGIVLIISNKFPDGFKRIYMSTINRIGDETEFVKVDLNTQYYILKEHLVGKIMPEKVLPLNNIKLKQILNMDSNSLYLNKNKTPYWQITYKLSIVELFGKYQNILKDILNEYDDVVYPKTVLKSIPNLY